jgi:hypothetical protein
MKKKSQIEQVFIYLVSTLIIILVLFFGYGAIKNVTKKQKELSFVQFQKLLTDMVSYTSSDYGTVRIEDFVVPAGYTEVCLVDMSLIMTADTLLINSSKYPIIYDSVSGSIRANVFVIPGGNPFFIEKMAVNDKFLCAPVVNSKIRLRFEGKGDSTVVRMP